MNKKIIGIIIGVLLLLGIGTILYFHFTKEKNVVITDAEKFALEYSSVTSDNVFVYRSEDEIIKILENGTGIVYLGFPECPWCQKYVTYLNEVAKESGISCIYYLNILEMRKNNTENYQKIVSLLGDNLLFDDEGNPRVYVPDVTAVVKGEIVGHDNQSSVVTEEDGTPEEYWTEKKVSKLKTKLKKMMEATCETACTSCNE